MMPPVTFAHPHLFWVLVALPALAAAFLMAERARRVALDRLLAVRLQPRLAGSVSVGRRRLAFALLLAGLALCITALAGPRWGMHFEEMTGRGRDVIIAMDTSRSMLAQDMTPNRLERAKYAALDLLKELEGDRVGLVAFAGVAFLQAPLTPDHGAIEETIRSLNTENIGQNGSNLASAIEAASEAFGKGESLHRALILFSDGEELEEDAMEAAEKHKDRFRIFTVGVGTEGGAPVIRPLRRGAAEYVRDQNGNVVLTKLDETRLREVAKRGGGFYLRLQNGPKEMHQLVLEGLGTMSDKDIETRTKEVPHERFEWPLTAGLLCLAASVLLGERRRLARVAVTLLAVLWLPATAEAKGDWIKSIGRFLTGGSSEQEDEDGKAPDPAKQLRQAESLRERRPDVPEIHYNVGCAAFTAGDFDKAASAFSNALGTGDPALKANAAYNLGNSLARRGASKEKEAKLADWKSAVEQYDHTLALAPGHAQAKQNRDIVQRAIEALEKKEQQEQQKKDDPKKDQNQQNKEDSKQNDQKQDSKQDQKDQNQKSDQKNDPNQQGSKQDQQKENSDEKGNQKQAKPDKAGDKQEDPKPGEQQGDPKPEPDGKKPDKEGKGDLQQAEPADQSKDQQEAAEAAKAAREGRMTEKDARALLNSMRKYKDVLPPMEQLMRRPTRPPGGKDW
jgi:Ca-activated chloride channel family protein